MKKKLLIIFFTLIILLLPIIALAKDPNQMNEDEVRQALEDSGKELASKNYNRQTILKKLNGIKYRPLDQD